MIDNSIYQFNVQKLNGEEVSLAEYKNKVLLIVNTASQCGFTPQLKELADLKDKFGGQDFEILAFPSNDFGGQEPLDGKELATFCEIQRVNYPVFEKIRVRGPYAHPLYKFFSDKKANGKLNSVPRWNFHKFLISKTGVISDFYFPFTKPTSSKIRKRISRLLADDK
ncbi:glutathione peroxidase [Mucilaginibacter gotjawali]|uniref:Glutathione peroxidase n=2 Tax=Mucilaginibacter gotjawali TaxID=1550579 RepID=A0A839SCP8_9SPHI|nr:glutathione peroxidase [Mucilaginibacter gotjawali]MBB3055566.1 glutathione peroxidase [Mucilaginibacter gotjawali]BAU53154.1 Hydroperoxy fatty acid reductase gpx1 [Mucilaginibacter gotjawali]